MVQCRPVGRLGHGRGATAVCTGGGACPTPCRPLCPPPPCDVRFATGSHGVYNCILFTGTNVISMAVGQSQMCTFVNLEFFFAVI